jgi:hypothetical protein
MKLLGLLAALTTAILAASAVVPEEAIQIIVPGRYPAGADKVESGEGWWGIFPEREGFALRSTSIVVSSFRYDADDVEGQESGVAIAIPQETKPVALVRGLKEARPGPLASVKPTGEYWPFLYPGQFSNLSLDSKSRTSPQVRLHAFGVAEPASGPMYVMYKKYELRLIRGRSDVIQLLPDFPDFEGECPRLLWAGDLDRDGQLDLILDRSTSEFSLEPSLFVSSAAKRGELVGLVAEWHAHYGC